MVGPQWVIPVELVRGLAAANDTARLLRLAGDGCVLSPHARLELAAAGFVAEVQYEHPGYPGQAQHTPVRLAVPPAENAIDRPRSIAVRR